MWKTGDRVFERFIPYLPNGAIIAAFTYGRPRFLKHLETLLEEPLPFTERPVEVYGLKFRNDLGNAAGMDKDGKLLKFNYFMGAGFGVVGTVLSKPHTGNDHGYLGSGNTWVRLGNSGSALNSLGLPSKGYKVVLDNIKRFQDEVQPVDFPIKLSIMGFLGDTSEKKRKEELEVVKAAKGIVDIIQKNDSCPNVKHDEADTSGDEYVKHLQELRAEAGMPVEVKLGTAGKDEEAIQHTADTLIGIIDGIALVNTQKERIKLREGLNKKDQALFDHYTKHYGGGLSGRAIYKLGLKQISDLWTAVDGRDLVLTHVGGLRDPEQIAASRAYAPLREWYTGYVQRLLERLGSDRLNEVYQEVL